MSTTLQAISDSLPSDVPKLVSSGMNWAIFKLCFAAAVKAKGQWGHFNGTTPKPSPLAPLTDGTPAPNAPGKKWDKDKVMVKNLMLQKIPDSVAMKIRQHPTMALTWASIVKEYT
jgi:hypothetical protein